MVLISKKGIAFSILALFLSFIIFAFGALQLNEGDYTKEKKFNDARISFINNEVNYFKNTYLPNLMSFSLYNVINGIVENETIIKSINKNHDLLNLLIAENALNGTIYGINQTYMENKTITYFVNTFSNDFYNNLKGNFSYTLLEINAYEKTPYYLSFQVKGIYNITAPVLSEEDISWFFNDSFELSIPLFGVRDPQFTLYANSSINNDILLNPYELYGPSTDWDLSSFNESLSNIYSALYLEKNYKYSIGDSFLSRLLDLHISAYKDVVGFWSFDYDEEQGRVYDTTQINNFGKFYGNSRFLFNLNNETISSPTIYDLSDYNNSGFIYGNINCSVRGIFKEGCSFDGIGDYIEIPYDKSLDTGFNSFSISLWAKFNNWNTTKNETLLFKKNSFILRKSKGSSGASIDFLVYDGSNYEPRLSGISVDDNKWEHIVAIYNQTYLSLYQNGVLISQSLRGSLNLSSPYNITIGSDDNKDNLFNGTIDEIALYSKELSFNEIAQLYEEKEIKQIDYKESLHGKGIELDGIDDYVEINMSSTLNSFPQNNFSIEIWFKPQIFDKANLLTHPGEIAIGYDFNNPLKGLSFKDDHGNGADTDSQNLNFEEKYYHFVGIYDNSTGNSSIYINGELILNEKEGIWNSTGDGGILRLGFGDSTIYDGVSSSNFKGIIDEVKIHNRSLSLKEIEQNYYNFAGYQKGCCNYITLINPNSMGYNNTNFDQNISYSSRLFFDKYIQNISDYNITLFNVTNITSSQTNKSYYNFLVDSCIRDAYSLTDFSFQSIIPVKVGFDNAKCSLLIKHGIY